MSMTSSDLKSFLLLVYKLVFLSVGLYMVLSGRLSVSVFDTLSKAVGTLLGGLDSGLRSMLIPMAFD